jgi:hypothetical protein
MKKVSHRQDAAGTIPDWLFSTWLIGDNRGWL